MSYTISIRCPNCARKMSYSSDDQAPEKCLECVKEEKYARAEDRAQKMAGDK